MAVPRSKKKKDPIHKPTKTPFEIVKMTNYFHLALIVRMLWTEYGWRDKRIANFLEGYLALVKEVMDKRNSVWGAVRDCKALTGVDVVKLLDELEREEK